MYLAFNPRRCGTMMAIDGQETWLIHNFLYNDEPDYDSGRPRLGDPRRSSASRPDFEYEIISKEDWIGRRLVADRFPERSRIHLRATPRICGSRTPATE